MTYDPYADRDRVTVERTTTTTDPEPVVHERVVTTTSPIDTIRRIVWLLFGVLQALIVLRIILLLLNANEGNDIVSFIVGVTDPFVEPFRDMFRLNQVNGASGSVLDVAAIVALIAWTLIEALVLGVVSLADRRSTVA
jgi:YggT family protein